MRAGGTAQEGFGLEVAIDVAAADAIMPGGGEIGSISKVRLYGQEISVEDFSFGALGSGLKNSGFRVKGLGIQVLGAGFTIQGSVVVFEFQVLSFGLWVKLRCLRGWRRATRRTRPGGAGPLASLAAPTSWSALSPAEIGNLLPNNRRQRRTCYALCHILYPVSAAHTSIFRMDSNSTSYEISPAPRGGGSVSVSGVRRLASGVRD